MGHTDTIQIPTFTTASPEYEADFHAWLMEQANRLRMLRVPGIDGENLAEEVEALARKDKREIRSRLEILLMHLLKWRYQPALRGASWRTTIHEQRHAIELVLEDSPSLRPTLPAAIAKAYPAAVRMAVLETNFAKSVFPATCEWTTADILSEDFLPDA